MKLDFVPQINKYGENLVRLYDFSSKEARKFKELIEQVILQEGLPLNLAEVDFIESRNCLLTLRLSLEDEGISTEDNFDFVCDLTAEGYEKMVKLIEPFAKQDRKGFQWLYDADTPTDFLFSPRGTEE